MISSRNNMNASAWGRVARLFLALFILSFIVKQVTWKAKSGRPFIAGSYADTQAPAIEPPRIVPPAITANAIGLLPIPELDEPFPGYRVVSDSGGVIRQLLLHYLEGHEAELKVVYDRLFPELSPWTQLVVLCPYLEDSDSFQANWGRMLTRRGHQVKVIVGNRDFSVWARDRCIAIENTAENRIRLFIPNPYFYYTGDKINELIAWPKLHSAGFFHETSLHSFFIEGGNLIANGRHVMAGLNSLLDNEDKFPSQRHLEEQLDQVFSKKPVIIGSAEEPLPWDHVDMYLTLVNDNQALIADTDLPLRLYASRSELKAALPDWPDSELPSKSGLQTKLDRKSLQLVRSQLEALDYEVRAIPAVFDRKGEAMITYNNVVLEQSNDRRVAFVPVYQVDKLDRYAADAYVKLGFKVVPLDVSGIYYLGGAVRCLFNVMQRYPANHAFETAKPPASGEITVVELEPFTP